MSWSFPNNLTVAGTVYEKISFDSTVQIILTFDGTNYTYLQSWDNSGA